jgi:hypothetical protein
VLKRLLQFEVQHFVVVVVYDQQLDDLKSFEFLLLKLGVLGRHRRMPDLKHSLPHYLMHLQYPMKF